MNPYVAVKMQELAAQLFATPWTAAHQAPMSTEFFRQEYWNRLLFPPLGDLPNPGIESMFPALVGEFFITKPPEKLTYLHRRNKNIHPYKTCAWELYS